MMARAMPLNTDSITFRNWARAGNGAVSTMGPLLAEMDQRGDRLLALQSCAPCGDGDCLQRGGTRNAQILRRETEKIAARGLAPPTSCFSLGADEGRALQFPSWGWSDIFFGTDVNGELGRGMRALERRSAAA